MEMGQVLFPQYSQKKLEKITKELLVSTNNIKLPVLILFLTKTNGALKCKDIFDIEQHLSSASCLKRIKCLSCV